MTKAHVHFSYSTETIAEKDSRDIDESDREKLATAIADTAHQNLVITHGTFTMVQTGLFLKEKNFADKKIVLTGSMIPISGFSASDAGFNLGFVIGSFASLESGVYLSMNGGMFTPDEVEKNEELFRFE